MKTILFVLLAALVIPLTVFAEQHHSVFTFRSSTSADSDYVIVVPPFDISPCVWNEDGTDDTTTIRVAINGEKALGTNVADWRVVGYLLPIKHNWPSRKSGTALVADLAAIDVTTSLPGLSVSELATAAGDTVSAIMSTDGTWATATFTVLGAQLAKGPRWLCCFVYPSANAGADSYGIVTISCADQGGGGGDK